MPNAYDNILSELVEEIFVPMAQRMLQIYPARTEEIPDDLLHTIERKPDFLKKVLMDGWGPDYLLHIEFQTTNDSGMIYRMLEYYAMMSRKYGLPVVQCVFYLGNEPLRMRNSIEHERLLFSYPIHDFRSLSAIELLKSDKPEEILLAILGDFDSLPSEMIIQQILTRLRYLPGESLELDQCVKQLEVLSQLRNLQEEITQILSAMPFTYDLEKDIRFQQGLTKGVEATRRQTVIRMLSSKQFKRGILTLDGIAELTGTSPTFVRQVWKSLDGGSLPDQQ